MPIHDWTRVPAGIFHDFRFGWVSELGRALNGGILPACFYAMAERTAGMPSPREHSIDGLTPTAGPPASPEADLDGALALASDPPLVRFHARDDAPIYATRAKAVVVRHASDHRVVAMVELVSPGNKASRYAIDTFARKARQAMQDGIHLLIVDLFPPGPRDPGGLHRLIWDEGTPGDFALPTDEPLACLSYVGGPAPQVFLEPIAVGQSLPEEMPLFLDREHYVPVPLDTSYRAAFDAVPAVWRDVLATPDRA